MKKSFKSFLKHITYLSLYSITYAGKSTAIVVSSNSGAAASGAGGTHDSSQSLIQQSSLHHYSEVTRSISLDKDLDSPDIFDFSLKDHMNFLKVIYEKTYLKDSFMSNILKKTIDNKKKIDISSASFQRIYDLICRLSVSKNLQMSPMGIKYKEFLDICRLYACSLKLKKYSKFTMDIFSSISSIIKGKSKSKELEMQYNIAVQQDFFATKILELLEHKIWSLHSKEIFKDQAKRHFDEPGFMHMNPCNYFFMDTKYSALRSLDFSKFLTKDEQTYLQKISDCGVDYTNIVRKRISPGLSDLKQEINSTKSDIKEYQSRKLKLPQDLVNKSIDKRIIAFNERYQAAKKLLKEGDDYFIGEQNLTVDIMVQESEKLGFKLYEYAYIPLLGNKGFNMYKDLLAKGVTKNQALFALSFYNKALRKVDSKGPINHMVNIIEPFSHLFETSEIQAKTGDVQSSSDFLIFETCEIRAKTGDVQSSSDLLNKIQMFKNAQAVHICFRPEKFSSLQVIVKKLKGQPALTEDDDHTIFIDGILSLKHVLQACEEIIDLSVLYKKDIEDFIVKNTQKIHSFDSYITGTINFSTLKLIQAYLEGIKRILEHSGTNTFIIEHEK